jgi:uncharacterized protein
MSMDVEVNWILSIAFGGLVGFALGLTGGGGSIFAVPLLVYGLNTTPHQAVGISLASVGAIAAVGVVPRFWRHEIEVGVGLLFAAAGMIGAPLGAWLNSFIAPEILLTLFAGLMLVMAGLMWRQAAQEPKEPTVGDVPLAKEKPNKNVAPVCERTPQGRLAITMRCRLVLAALGLGTGIMSGLFGVGGGFVIVPALVLFSGMEIHRAIATSLLVIALVSASGTASYVFGGREIDFLMAGLFIAGGVLGMGLGILLGRRLAGPALQRVFSMAMIVVAFLVVVQNLLGKSS